METMVVGILRLELQFYEIASLKGKRSILQKILSRCRNRFPVSCAETGLHDLWQRSEIGVSMVNNDRRRIESVFTELEAEIVRTAEAEITDSQIEFIQY